MSDLFHPQIPDSYIVRVAEVMMQAQWHTYQVLTKRAERLERLLSESLRFATKSPHIWWGVSIENVRHGKPRIERLRNAPAAVRFLSVEPLLEDLGKIDLTDIHWVIVGGESGPGSRPIREEWVLSILKACREQRVPFFFKQWGGVAKKKTGRTLRGRTYDQFPGVMRSPIPPFAERREMIRKLDSGYAGEQALCQIAW